MHGLQLEDGARGRRGDVRVAVAVAADPGAEAQRTDLGGQLHVDRGQLVAQLLQHVGQGRGGQALEVVDAVARLVDRLRRLDPDLVGAPEHLDGLLQPAGAAGRVRLLEQGRDLAHLLDRGAAGDLGGVRGEHRPHRHLRDLLRDRLGVDAGLADARERVVHPARRTPLVAARPQQRPPAVHLLGDVGEVEVRRERPCQLRGRLEVQLGQLREGVVLRERPDPLDQGEQVVALGPLERVAQQRGDQAYVAAEVGVGRAVGWIVHTEQYGERRVSTS